MKRSFEIAGAQLKSYILSSKSFKFTTDGGHLEPRGQITLGIEDAYSIDIYLHRLSGNGHFNINLDNDNQFKIVSSKKPQKFSFPFKSGNLKISRPESALGQLAITKIEVYTGVEEKTVAYNWKELIKRCGRYGSLRLVNDQLFASAGGFIEDNGRIDDIQTDPPNMYTRENNKIKFINSCNITSLSLKTTTSPQREELFSSRSAAFPNINPAKGVPSVGNVKPISMPKPVINVSDAVKGTSLIVYDSSALKGFQKYLHVKSKLVSSIKSNGKGYLLLRQGGTASLSISTLHSNKNYICILIGKCLNGNGKIHINISSKEGDLSHCKEISLSRSPNFESKYVHIKVPKLKYGDTSKVNIYMPQIGEVLIERVLIVDSLDIQHARETVEGRSFAAQRQKTPQTISVDVQVDSQDPIFRIAKRYARYKAHDFESKLDIEGNIYTNTALGLIWANKIKSICSLVEIRDVPHALMIADINSSNFRAKTWLEPFNYLNNEQIEKLKQCEKIFTPSEYNLEILKNKCPNSDIQLMTKPLPWVEPQLIELFKNMDYLVGFHRDEQSTKALINCWDSSLPKLVLIGARGSFDDNIIPVNEYVSYSKLIYILQQAKAMIDISKIYHSNSSFQELSLNLGVPVLTNAWPALTNDKMVFLPTNKGVPGAKGLHNGVRGVLGKENRQTDSEAIKNNFNSKIQSLLS